MATVPRMFKWGAGEELVPGSVYQNLKAVEGLKKGRTTAQDHPPVEPRGRHRGRCHATQPPRHRRRYGPPTASDRGEAGRGLPDTPEGLGPQQRSLAIHPSEPQDGTPTGKGRIIYIGPQAQTVLRPYLDRPSDTYCFSPAESEDKRREKMRARRDK